MAGHGPPPKDPQQRRRRNSSANKVTPLPAGGRKGPAPKWPIPLAQIDSPTAQKLVRKLEAEVWKELWSTPQAEAWVKVGYFREVAQYVRWKVRGELGDLDAAKEARMLSDRLGLTPMAMKHLLWEIDSRDEVADKREEHSSSRRLKAVDPAGRAAK